MCRIESPATAKRDAMNTDPSKPIDFTFTPQERDVVLLTQLDVIAMKNANRQYTPGLVVIHLEPSELTEQERDSYARFGGVL